jgi:hypothetical protein
MTKGALRASMVGVPIQPIIRPTFGAEPSASSGAVSVLDAGETLHFNMFNVSTWNIRPNQPFWVQHFDPPGPGTYSVVFQYEYSGTDDAFHGLLTAPPVTFVVTQ